MAMEVLPDLTIPHEVPSTPFVSWQNIVRISWLSKVIKKFANHLQMFKTVLYPPPVHLSTLKIPTCQSPQLSQLTSQITPALTSAH